MMRHWLDKIGAIVDGLGNRVGEATSMVFVGCIHPLVGNQWWNAWWKSVWEPAGCTMGWRSLCVICY